MSNILTPVAVRRIGAASAVTTVAASALYGPVLLFGLAARTSHAAPIADPWLAAMEALILFIAPAMVVLIGSLHAQAAENRKMAGLAAVVCMVVAVAITCAVHLSLLLGPRAAAHEAFLWPSPAYVLDVVAWDGFFPSAALLSASLVEGAGVARVARLLLIASGVLAFAGLAGVPTGDMGIRNVGILGYAVIFPLAAVFLAVWFARKP